MKRTLALMAATALLALSLAGCGDMADRTDDYDTAPGGTTATDTMRSDNGVAGTGTTNGAASNADTATGGLGSVTGAVNASYGSARYGAADRYAASPNGYVPTRPETDAAADARYALMLENGRVHDTDGFLLDGENTNWRTF